MVSAKDFVDQVKIPLFDGWGYIYGQWGSMWTKEKQEQLNKTTESKYAKSRQYGSKWIGHMVTDCSGLVRWALHQYGQSIAHHAWYQYTDYCKNKGKLIDGQREDGQKILPGTAVFLKGSQDHIHHVGVYVGDDTVIEAKGAYYGVVTSQLTHWDYWGELKMVDYTGADEIETEPIQMPEVQKAIVDNPGKWLNVRSQPSESATKLFELHKGDEVEVIDSTSTVGWWQIKYGGRIGWASSKYLKAVKANNQEESGSDEIFDEPEEQDKMIDVWERLVSIRTKLNELSDNVWEIMDIINQLED